jgi:hypothetical protein
MTDRGTEIERVARAIERAWSKNHASIKSDPDIAWKVWTPEAEAAISAANDEIARLQAGLHEALNMIEARLSKRGER